MTKEELKKFFERYDIFTLDSLDILISYLNEEEQKEIYPPFNSIYNKKYKEVEREFEGINEYDFICKLLNFDIKDIIDDIDTLSKKELDFLNHIITVSLSKISKNEVNYKMINNLLECINNIDLIEKYAMKNTTIDDSFTEEELENFFNKFSITELEQFNILLECARFEWNVKRLYKIYKQVLDSKDVYKDYSSIDKYNKALSESKISDLEHKIYKLNKKELNLLKNLVEVTDAVIDNEYEDTIKEINTLENTIVKKLEKK